MIKTIKCNGMPLPIICKNCEYGKVTDDYSEVECFAPDIDGIPVVGILKDEDG